MVEFYVVEGALDGLGVLDMSKVVLHNLSFDEELVVNELEHVSDLAKLEQELLDSEACLTLQL